MSEPENKVQALEDMDNGEKRHGLLPSAYEWKAISFLADTFVKAGALPKGIDTIPKAIVILQAGLESGLTPLQAFNSFYIVNGKVTMYGEAVPRQIIKAGHKITWGHCDDTIATVTITRGDTQESMSQTLEWDTAVKRGYTRTDIWQKFPENMLKWRALSMVAKFICPDALNGVPIKEDIESDDLNLAPDKAAAALPEAEKPETPKLREGRKPLAEAIDAPDEPVEPKVTEPKKKGKTKPSGDEDLKKANDDLLKRRAEEGITPGEAQSEEGAETGKLL